MKLRESKLFSSALMTKSYLKIYKMNSESGSKFSVDSIQRVRRRRRKRRKEKGRNLSFGSEMFCIMTTVLLLLLHNKGIVKADSPPRITIQPNDLIAIEGESAELNCDADGQPEPSIEWYHNGQLIKASKHSRTTMGGSIQFLDIRPPSSFINSNINTNINKQDQSDTGIYYCLAKNSLGQAKSRNASLQVACKYSMN